MIDLYFNGPKANRTVKMPHSLGRRPEKLEGLMYVGESHTLPLASGPYGDVLVYSTLENICVTTSFDASNYRIHMRVD